MPSSLTPSSGAGTPHNPSAHPGSTPPLTPTASDTTPPANALVPFTPTPPLTEGVPPSTPSLSGRASATPPPQAKTVGDFVGKLQGKQKDSTHYKEVHDKHNLRAKILAGVGFGLWILLLSGIASGVFASPIGVGVALVLAVGMMAAAAGTSFDKISADKAYDKGQLEDFDTRSKVTQRMTDICLNHTYPDDEKDTLNRAQAHLPAELRVKHPSYDQLDAIGKTMGDEQAASVDIFNDVYDSGEKFADLNSKLTSHVNDAMIANISEKQKEVEEEVDKLDKATPLQRVTPFLNEINAKMRTIENELGAMGRGISGVQNHADDQIDTSYRTTLQQHLPTLSSDDDKERYLRDAHNALKSESERISQGLASTKPEDRAAAARPYRMQFLEQEATQEEAHLKQRQEQLQQNYADLQIKQNDVAILQAQIDQLIPLVPDRFANMNVEALNQQKVLEENRLNRAIQQEQAQIDLTDQAILATKEKIAEHEGTRVKHLSDLNTLTAAPPPAPPPSPSRPTSGEDQLIDDDAIQMEEETNPEAILSTEDAETHITSYNQQKAILEGAIELATRQKALAQEKLKQQEANRQTHQTNKQRHESDKMQNLDGIDKAIELRGIMTSIQTASNKLAELQESYNINKPLVDEGVQAFLKKKNYRNALEFYSKELQKLNQENADINRVAAAKANQARDNFNEIESNKRRHELEQRRAELRSGQSQPTDNQP